MAAKEIIPAEALRQHLAILGKTGSGKSYAARGIVESILDLGHRVCILDYTGVWSGLRSSANGKLGAFPVVIFGGEHADVPISEHAGHAVARIVAEGNRPSIIDLDGMSVSAQQRFVTAFLEELYRLNSAPLHLVLEEIDEFAPQSGAHGTERMLGAVCRIFQRGRRKGFRAIAITQRPANLHKRVLTQCNAMVAMRLVAPQDRKAIAEWIRGHADDETGKRVVDSLPKLARGEGWVWVPEQDVLARVAFPPIRTFDTMRAPEDGIEAEPVGWADVDLDAVRGEMAEAVAEAEANDPKHLKAELARLKAEKGKTAAPVTGKEIEAAEARGFDLGCQHERKAWNARLSEIRARVNSVLDADLAVTIRKEQRADVAKPAPTHWWDERDALKSQPSSSIAAALSGPERALLSALAWWEAVGQMRPSRAMACAIAGWRVTSGHIKNVSGALKTKGLVTYPSDGRLALTESGRSAAEPPASDGRSLAAFVRDTLTGPQAQAFDVLLRHPAGLDRETLCGHLEWDPKSGHIKNVLGSMRSMEIVEYPEAGSVRLVEWIREQA